MSPLEDMAFSERGDRLIACDALGQIRTWDLATGRATTPVELPQSAHMNYAERTIWFQLAPGGKRVAAVLEKWDDDGNSSDDQTLSIWDTGSGKVLLRRPADHGLYRSSTWSADGSVLALAGSCHVEIVDATTAKELHRFSTGRMGSFSTDGRLVACWNEGKKNGDPFEIHFTETVTGQPVAVVSELHGSTTTLAIAAAARALLTADEQFLYLHDVATGKKRGRFALPDMGRGHSTGSPVVAIRVLPGDRHVLTSLADGTALIWDLSAFPTPALADKHGLTEMRTWWEELADEDAARAFLAGWKLTESSAPEVLKFLRERVRPVGGIDKMLVQKLIGDLDSAKFATREVASWRLLKMGLAVLPEVRRRPSGLSAEVVERLTRLEEHLTNPIPTGETLRILRAVAVLQRIGTIEARKLLEDLAGGFSDAPETRAAQWTMRQLKQGRVNP